MIYNSSSYQDLIIINSDDHIISSYNIFDSCIQHESSFIIVKGTDDVEFHNLTIFNTSYVEGELQSGIISISTTQDGNWFLEDLDFHDNQIGSKMIQIDNSVGNLTIQNCKFKSENMSSDTDYIVISNPYKLFMQHLTYTDCYDNHDLTSNAHLIVIRSINLSIKGDVIISYIESDHSPVSFLQLSDVDGVTSATKSIAFDHITIKNATYDTRNDLIIIGEYETNQDVNVSMSYLDIQNIEFTKFANVLHVKQQSVLPFRLYHSYFKKVNGGKILLEAINLQDDSLLAKMIIDNSTVYENDFKFSAFIVQEHHSELTISNSRFYRNTAMFRGRLNT